MFSDIVALYREANRPAFQAGHFRYSGPITPALREIIARLEALDDTFGRFEDAPEWNNGEVEFCWLVGDNEHGHFYSNVAELVDRSQSLSQGKRPNNFYLVADDHFAGEDNAPELLGHAYDLCELIQLLGRISLNENLGSTSQLNGLIFVIPAGEKSPPRTLSLSTRLEPSLLTGKRPDLNQLRMLVSGDSDHSLHIHELRALFRLAIANTAGRAPPSANAFTFLVSHWDDVLEKYSFDVDCYISSFSFEKIRIEIAQIELDFSGKLSSVMGDSATKFLALPIPLAAVAAIYKVEGIADAYLIFVGALMTVMIFSALIKNQLLQLTRIEHSFSVISDQFIKKINSYPTSIANRLTEASNGFAKQRSFLYRTLWVLRVLSWLPIIASLTLLAWKYHPGFRTWISIGS